MMNSALTSANCRQIYFMTEQTESFLGSIMTWALLYSKFFGNYSGMSFPRKRESIVMDSRLHGNDNKPNNCIKYIYIIIPE